MKGRTRKNKDELERISKLIVDQATQNYVKN